MRAPKSRTSSRGPFILFYPIHLAVYPFIRWFTSWIDHIPHQLSAYPFFGLSHPFQWFIRLSVGLPIRWTMSRTSWPFFRLSVYPTHLVVCPFIRWFTSWMDQIPHQLEVYIRRQLAVHPFLAFIWWVIPLSVGLPVGWTKYCVSLRFIRISYSSSIRLSVGLPVGQTKSRGTSWRFIH